MIRADNSSVPFFDLRLEENTADADDVSRWCGGCRGITKSNRRDCEAQYLDRLYLHHCAPVGTSPRRFNTFGLLERHSDSVIR